MDTIQLQLSNNCRFHLGDEPDAWQAWYDDSAWQEVTLPHDWSVSLPFSREYSSGTGYLAGGIGWYRLHITPDESWRGKQISITFDGVYKNSRVWCNSYYLGERPNGYISFTYDITQQFHFDADNIISVYVDHREIADSRWFTGSGITRKVTLTVEEAVHPVPNGVFFTTPAVSHEEASYQIKSELINCLDEDCSVTVTSLLFSQDSSPVSEELGQTIIPAGQTATITTSGIVQNPKLWSPEEPNLYTLKLYVSYSVSNQEKMTHVSTLSYQTQVGIRSFHFSPNHGFSLNGTPYLFKGVCVHHDAGCLGAAVTPVVWYRRLLKLKEMGCNAIRMSHNPHMPELYDLCDSLGFFVMDEVFDEWEGPKNKWSTGHNVYPPKHQGYYVYFPAWHKQDLTDMIRRDRNHPSIIMWSIGNEIDYPNDPYCHASFDTMTGNNDANKPAAERVYNPLRPDASRLAYLAKHLCGIAKKADSTRPVTLAAAFPELSAKLGFIDSLDVVGFNYKEHLYEEHHKAFPEKPFLGSENGHGYAQWKAVTDCPYISGQFLWTGIDYLGEAHGWPIHGSGAGLLTLAGFEKTSYYRRQSFWSDKPVIHLATIREEDSRFTTWGEELPNALACEFAPVSECWNYKNGEMVVVKCYTNLPQVEIFLNGRSLGIHKKEPGADCILFTIAYAPGELKAVGTTAHECKISHSLYTTECACQIQLTPCNIPQLQHSQFEKEQLRQIEVTMLDAAGHRVYNDSSLLQVSVQNGKLIGLENGNLADVTDYTSTSRRAYHGQLLIYALPTEACKPMTIQVSGEMLPTTRLNI